MFAAVLLLCCSVTTVRERLGDCRLEDMHTHRAGGDTALNICGLWFVVIHAAIAGPSDLWD